MTSTIVPREALDPDELPFALDKYAKWVSLRLRGMENPHVFISGGSRWGKTTLQILLAAVAASRGDIVIILDPKLRFTRAFRRPKTHERVPHVMVYSNPDDDAAARMFQGALELVKTAMQRRYEDDEQSDVATLGDRRKFPNVFVIIDEQGTALQVADKEWPQRKPERYKGKTPTREFLQTILAMGAEAGYIACSANQNMSVNDMPTENTNARKLYEQRINLGNVAEPDQRRMLWGDRKAPPDVPIGQKGAGSIAFGTTEPFLIQAAFIDWENYPEQVYNLAAQGVDRLRADGHIDKLDQLWLGDLRVPSPAEMVSLVETDRLHLRQLERPQRDTPQRQPESATAEDSVEESEEPEPVQDIGVKASSERFIVGNDRAAEFCGMTESNFRQQRHRNPIPGTKKNYERNKPGFPEQQLREWAEERRLARAARDRKAA